MVDVADIENLVLLSQTVCVELICKHFGQLGPFSKKKRNCSSLEQSKYLLFQFFIWNKLDQYFEIIDDKIYQKFNLVTLQLYSGKIKRFSIYYNKFINFRKRET